MSTDQATAVAALTPHRWEAHERNILRAFILTLAEGNYQRAQEHAQSLGMAARRELLYALDVGHPMVRALVDPSPLPDYVPIVRHDSIRVEPVDDDVIVVTLSPQRSTCRFCASRLEHHPGGWFDLDGFSNCGTGRTHEPAAKTAAVTP